MFVCAFLIGKTEKEHHKAGADLHSRSLFASPEASTASRRAKEAGSRTVVRDILNAIVAVKAHRSVQPQADEFSARDVVTLAWQHRAGGAPGWVDHPKGDHDVFANACCGVLRELSTYLGYD